MAPKQFNDLAAAVALGPGVKVIELKSAVEYENVHSSPAGCETAEVRDRSKETLPPATPVPEARDNET